MADSVSNLTSQAMKMTNCMSMLFALGSLALLMHHTLDAADEAKVARWRWAPLRCHVQVFPEIDVGNEIHEDVAVVYYTTKAKSQPLEDDIMRAINEESVKHKIDRSKLPMAEELGYMLLHDTVADEYHMLIVQERGTVLFLKVECKFSEPAVYQPLYGRKSKITAFHSEALAKRILAIKDVQVPDKELPPWMEKKP